MGFRVWGLGFRIRGDEAKYLGFWGLGFEAMKPNTWGLGFRVLGPGVMKPNTCPMKPNTCPNFQTRRSARMATGALKTEY